MGKFQSLIDELQDHDIFYIRSEAAKALGEIKDPRAVEPLIAALGDEYENVRSNVLAALDRIDPGWRDSPEARNHISEFITCVVNKGESLDVRSAAARALGEIRDPRAVEPLIATLDDKEEEVRINVLAALDRIDPGWRDSPRGNERISEFITCIANKNESLEARRAAIQALGEIKDPRAVEPLIAVLPDEDWGVHSYVEEHLGAQDESIRSAAARALGEIKDQRAVEPLIVALGDEDGYIRIAAARALGEIKDPLAVEPLIASLDDEEGYTRTVAARALGEIKDPLAVEPLIAALDDENFGVRDAAASALGEIRDPLAVEPLIASLGDEDWAVRSNATQALGKIGDPRAVESLIAALRNRDAIESTHPIVSFINYGVRNSVAEALCEIRDPRAVEPLIAALGDKDAVIRSVAARALGGIKDQRAVEPLIAALGDKDEDVRTNAQKALENMGSLHRT